MKHLITTVSDDAITVTIPAEYLENACEMGVTTNITGKVTDRAGMLKHFDRQFNSEQSDSNFGRFVDDIFEEAICDGEDFIEASDDEL